MLGQAPQTTFRHSWNISQCGKANVVAICTCFHVSVIFCINKQLLLLWVVFTALYLPIQANSRCFSVPLEKSQFSIPYPLCSWLLWPPGKFPLQCANMIEHLQYKSQHTAGYNNPEASEVFRRWWGWGAQGNQWWWCFSDSWSQRVFSLVCEIDIFYRGRPWLSQLNLQPNIFYFK